MGCTVRRAMPCRCTVPIRLMDKSPCHILGISAFYHDSAACLVRDGEIIAAVQEERFSRKKHDFSFPSNAIDYCLKEGGISVNDLSFIAFYDKPFVKFERILQTYLTFAPRGIESFLKAIPLWMKEKLWMKEVIRKETGFTGKLLFTEHHESHAASAFFPSPFDEAAFLTIDGVGEWATASFGTGRGHNIEILKELHFPQSLGLLYSAFTYYMGFKVNSGEYKVMGLAPYGEPRYRELILAELLDLKEDGSFRLNMDYFDYCTGLTMTNKRFNRLFGGPPRAQGAELTQKDMDLARSIQEVTEEIMLRMVRNVYDETGMNHLCLAGGVALNCVGNGRIEREGPFEGIWVQPAAGDAGGALGAALFCWYQYLGNRRKTDWKQDSQKGSCLGPAYSDDEIGTFLHSRGIPHTRLSDEELIPKVADLIADGKVIGWFQGHMEFGPRALGNRSILGDARSPQMQERINRKIKFRESFRPFAPSVLKEYASKYFHIDRESPYMLLVAPVREELRVNTLAKSMNVSGLSKGKIIRSLIPAVTHVDHSARIQTVDREDNPLYYQLIKCVYEKCGCPMIINTSFNVRGEPIVMSPEDGYGCFMKTGMDALIMGNYFLDKKEQHLSEGDLSREKGSPGAPGKALKRNKPRKIEEDKRRERAFGVTLGGGLFIAGVILSIMGRGAGPFILGPGIILLITTLIFPKGLGPLYSGWMALSNLLGWVMTRVVLFISYFLVLTPLGLAQRIFRKDSLNLKWKRDWKSYWVQKERKPSDTSSYEKQY